MNLVLKVLIKWAVICLEFFFLKKKKIGFNKFIYFTNLEVFNKALEI